MIGFAAFAIYSTEARKSSSILRFLIYQVMSPWSSRTNSTKAKYTSSKMPRRLKTPTEGCLKIGVTREV